MRKYPVSFSNDGTVYVGGVSVGNVSIHYAPDCVEFMCAANDALDEIEALVTYNEENNLYATKTYRDMVDILIRAGRR